MRVSDPLRYRQTQTRPAGSAAGWIGSKEAFEYPRKQVRGDSHSIVADAHQDRVYAAVLHFYLDAASLWRVFDGVVQESPEQARSVGLSAATCSGRAAGNCVVKL